jgi:uncharacterized protein (DUF1778 family)
MSDKDKHELTADELDALNRQPIAIPAEHWDEFLDWLERPPEFKPKLHALMISKPPWERSEVPAKD